MRMKHPQHGYHVPMPGERESMLKNGWVDEVEAPAAHAQEGLAVTEVEPSLSERQTTAAAIVPIKRGPGRPRKAA